MVKRHYKRKRVRNRGIDQTEENTPTRELRYAFDLKFQPGRFLELRARVVHKMEVPGWKVETIQAFENGQWSVLTGSDLDRAMQHLVGVHWHKIDMGWMNKYPRKYALSQATPGTAACKAKKVGAKKPKPNWQSALFRPRSPRP